MDWITGIDSNLIVFCVGLIPFDSLECLDSGLKSCVHILCLALSAKDRDGQEVGAKRTGEGRAIFRKLAEELDFLTVHKGSVG